MRRVTLILTGLVVAFSIYGTQANAGWLMRRRCCGCQAPPPRCQPCQPSTKPVQQVAPTSSAGTVHNVPIDNQQFAPMSAVVTSDAGTVHNVPINNVAFGPSGDSGLVSIPAPVISSPVIVPNNIISGGIVDNGHVIISGGGVVSHDPCGSPAPCSPCDGGSVIHSGEGAIIIHSGDAGSVIVNQPTEAAKPTEAKPDAPKAEGDKPKAPDAAKPEGDAAKPAEPAKPEEKKE